MAQARIKVLLTGSQGQIGAELRRILSGHCDLAAPGRREMDIGDVRQVDAAVEALRPDLVINAAAYTAVDRAESEPELAHRVNAAGPAALALAAARSGAALIHYSSDYVFDGSAHRPYQPDDPPAPLGTYGRSKLAGEQAVTSADGAALVLRTSWIYALRRRNFLLAMVRRADAGEHLRVVDDQVGVPTPAHLVAEATWSAIEAALQHDGKAWTFGGREGIHHVACGGSTSWYGFAQAIFDLLPIEPVSLEPISTDDFPAAAPRPRYSVLSMDGFRQAFGVELPHWRTALEQMFDPPPALEALLAGDHAGDRT